MRRALVLASLIFLAAAEPASADYWRECGNADAYHAYKIKAHQVSCGLAKHVAKRHTYGARNWKCKSKGERRGPYGNAQEKLRCKRREGGPGRIQFFFG